MWRRVHFSTLPRPEVKSPYHVWTKAPSGLVVSRKAIWFSVNMTLMGVFTYNRNAWKTQGKSYTHAIFHWSEMKTYQTALSGKWSFSEFSSTHWEKKNVCLLQNEAYRNSFHINLIILVILSRHAQPPLGLWLRALQCEQINILLWTPSICLLLDRNALRFSFCCKGNPENQAQCGDCSFLSSSCSESQI